MSFWKQFFICCDSTASHSDLLLNETKKKHSLKNQSTNHSHSPSKSPHLSHRITIRSIKKEDKNSKLNDTSSIKRLPSIDDYSDLYSINLLTQTQSIITSPEYIPLNNIEISSSKMENAKQLELTDIKGDLLYNQKIEVTYKGVVNKKQPLHFESYKKFDSSDTNQVKGEMIKCINYFWIKSKQQETAMESVVQKDFILNYECDYMSNLSTNYLFLICYIKEYNVYKIKINGAFRSNVLLDKISVQISHEYPKLLPRDMILIIGTKHLHFSLSVNANLRVEFEGRQFNYLTETMNSITIGKNKKCSIVIEEDSSDVHTTIFYDSNKENWFIIDGDNNEASKEGTWVFTHCPLLINDDMRLKIMNNEIVIKCK